MLLALRPAKPRRVHLDIAGFVLQIFPQRVDIARENSL